MGPAGDSARHTCDYHIADSVHSREEERRRSLAVYGQPKPKCMGSNNLHNLYDRGKARWSGDHFVDDRDCERFRADHIPTDKC